MWTQTHKIQRPLTRGFKSIHCSKRQVPLVKHLLCAKHVSDPMLFKLPSNVAKQVLSDRPMALTELFAAFHSATQVHWSRMRQWSIDSISEKCKIPEESAKWLLTKL